MVATCFFLSYRKVVLYLPLTKSCCTVPFIDDYYNLALDRPRYAHFHVVGTHLPGLPVTCSLGSNAFLRCAIRSQKSPARPIAARKQIQPTKPFDLCRIHLEQQSKEGVYKNSAQAAKTTAATTKADPLIPIAKVSDGHSHEPREPKD